MTAVPVLQMVDTLELGGYERVAVNLANALPEERYQPYLCATRRAGPLAAALRERVGLLHLRRAGSFDPAALARLVAFIRARGIRVLHPHGPSLFLARAAALFPPRPAVVWHAHAGRFAAEDRRALAYRAAVRGIGGVIAVNEALLAWVRRRLGVPEERSWYVPNPAGEAAAAEPAPQLPGAPGSRILCVGNLRPEKDHLTLLRAIAIVAQRWPAAHALLAGAAPDAAYAERLRAAARELGIAHHVTFLGVREDAAAVMRACDIGVLSSQFEGLPMALLEYGMAGLPVAATTAGQCGEVLEGGRAGILVPPGDPAALADALTALLASAELRATLGGRLRRRVEEAYSARAVVGRVCAIYDAVLAGARRAPAGATVSGESL